MKELNDYPYINPFKSKWFKFRKLLNLKVNKTSDTSREGQNTCNFTNYYPKILLTCLLVNLLSGGWAQRNLNKWYAHKFISFKKYIHKDKNTEYIIMQEVFVIFLLLYSLIGKYKVTWPTIIKITWPTFITETAPLRL